MYKHSNKYYKYEDGIVTMYEKVTTDDKEMIELLADSCITEKGEIYFEVDAAGLMRENWDNKAARDEYLAEFEMDIEAEREYLVEQAAEEFGF